MVVSGQIHAPVYLKEKNQSNSAYVIYITMRPHFQSDGFKTNLVVSMVLE